MEDRTKHYLQKLFVRRIAGKRLYSKIKFIKIYLKAILGADYEISQILLEVLKEDDVFFDIGANLGQYIIRIKRRYKKGVRIYAFEPLKSSFSILSNYINKHCPDVLLENSAVSDVSGVDTLYIPIIDNIEIDTQASIDLENRKMYYKEFKKQETKKVSIDRYVLEKCITKIDYLKIDTEGNDERVIKGALKSIANFTPIIFCEDMDGEEILEILSTLKYNRYLLTRDYKLTTYIHNKPDNIFNDLIIFIPENKKHIFDKYIMTKTQ
jgi:FkbM family methyltransferase